MRFSLIDKIVSLEKEREIHAYKNLSLAEEYLQDHFPGFPVMPGVLIMETMVQAGAWLMRVSTDFQHSTVLLKQAKAVRYKSFVAPGQTLNVHLKVSKWNDNLCTFKADGQVDGQSICNAKLTLQQSNLVDQNSDLAAADERLINHLKETLITIWPESKNESA